MSDTPTLNLDPAILTIFGITGDLAHRKLLPALYNLAENNLLPKTFKIVGTTRQDIPASDVIDKIKQNIEKNGTKTNAKTLKWIEDNLQIVTMDVTNENDYVKLKKQLDSIEDEAGECLHRLFYLAIPSNVFGPIITKLGESSLNTGCQHEKAESRLLIEKPFGYDLISAEELIETLNNSFTEKQIYRIDHYLAKETVQNIMTLRFTNPLFKSVWNRHHISHITITAAEKIGIESRVNFYEQTGALRDIIQSHLLQVLALVVMEQPKTVTAASNHHARQTVLDAVEHPRADRMTSETVRAQYEGYKQEVDNPDSQTETYAAVRFTIDNDTWRDVPVDIVTGKNLAEKTTKVVLTFSDGTNPDYVNYLTIQLQPNEGIGINLRIKRPGFKDETQHVQMDFAYNDQVDASHPDAYERVLIDTIRGDKTLFATSEEVIASWRIVQPILDAWQGNTVPMLEYNKGSWGPPSFNLGGSKPKT